MLHTEMIPQKWLCALDLLQKYHIIYPYLNIKLVFGLLEFGIFWKIPEARGLPTYILNFTIVDDEAFALANHIITSMLVLDREYGWSSSQDAETDWLAESKVNIQLI